MERIEVELFSDGGNNAIVRMPGRAFPGVVMQGDTLSAWYRQLADVAAALRQSPGDAEAIDELDAAIADLKEVLGGYENALSGHGLNLPY